MDRLVGCDAGRRGAPGAAYVRYRFHTRNMEMRDPLKKLSRALPDVRIAMVTQCLDDNDFGAYTFHKGRVSAKWLQEEWRLPFWERTARKLGMDVDEAYEDDVAEQRAESLMTDAAMRIATGVDRTYNWSGGRVYRDLWDERAAMMRDLAKAMKEME